MVLNVLSNEKIKNILPFPFNLKEHQIKLHLSTDNSHYRLILKLGKETKIIHYS
jgi:hypothetical protein